MGTETNETTIHDNVFQPKTRIGRKLWQIRQKIVASDEPLLGWKEVEQELTERRNQRRQSIE